MMKNAPQSSPERHSWSVLQVQRSLRLLPARHWRRHVSSYQISSCIPFNPQHPRLRSWKSRESIRRKWTIRTRDGRQPEAKKRQLRREEPNLLAILLDNFLQGGLGSPRAPPPAAVQLHSLQLRASWYSTRSYLGRTIHSTRNDDAGSGGPGLRTRWKPSPTIRPFHGT